MIKASLFISVGIFCGLWLAWPGIATSKGWECAKDIIFNLNKEPNDTKSILEDIQRKLKLTSAITPRTLLKAEKLDPIEKLRVVGDACFRF